MKCVNCNAELKPDSEWFIMDIDLDLLWSCTCGQKYEVDHYCEEEGCHEDIFPVKDS